MANWLDSKPKTGREKKPYYSEQVEMFDWSKYNKKWVRVRLIGPIVTYGQIWFNIKTKDGRKVSIPKISSDYNPETQEWEDKGCPYRELGEGREAQRFASNMIVRDLQELRPTKLKRTEKESKKRTVMGDYKAFIKEKGSNSYTPIRVLDIPSSLADDLKSLSETNKVKNKKTGKMQSYDLSHPKYGVDLLIKYDKDASGTSKWKVQKEERTALTEEELDDLIFDLNQPAIIPEKKSEAKRDAEMLKKVLDTGDRKKKNSDEDEDDDDEPVKKKKKNSPIDEDEDEDEPVKKKKKRRDEDEDDDEPTKKKKKKKNNRPKDDDDDLDDLDD